jgi:hypothetical protein
MYWHTLAHIPKGILEKIKKFCFNFLWQGSSEYKGTHWVNWIKIAAPKSLGGWGLKDIHIFNHSLDAKSLWNMITKESFWRRILIQKYIAPGTILDWTRKERKSTHNVSNQWKSLTLDFPVIGSFLA